MKSLRVYFVFIIMAVLTCSCKQSSQSKKKHDVDVKHSDKREKAINNPAKPTHFLIIDSLRLLFAVADTIKHNYGDNDTVDHVEEINFQIANTLKRILLDTVIMRGYSDSLLRIENLYITNSDDNRVRIFTWYENTGGSFKSHLSMLYCKLPSGKVVVSESGDIGDSGDNITNLFHSAGAVFDKVIKLRAKHKDIYLCMGGGIGCNTCEFSTASVIELQKDSVNFNYEAFNLIEDDVIFFGQNNRSCLTLGARTGDIEEFAFNTKTQTLKIVYLTDDTTPITTESNEKQRRYVRTLVFDGIKFRGDALH